jgi:hypothetical protein
MNDADITALTAAEKLALAQRLLAALSAELGGQPDTLSLPMDSASLSALQASLLTQVQGSLSADPAATDWNAVRKQVLNQP